MTYNQLYILCICVLKWLCPNDGRTVINSVTAFANILISYEWFKVPGQCSTQCPQNSLNSAPRAPGLPLKKDLDNQPSMLVDCIQALAMLMRATISPICSFSSRFHKGEILYIICPTFLVSKHIWYHVQYRLMNTVEKLELTFPKYYSNQLAWKGWT